MWAAAVQKSPLPRASAYAGRLRTRVGFLPSQKVFLPGPEKQPQLAKSLENMKLHRNTLVWVCSSPIRINCITVHWWTFLTSKLLRGAKVGVELHLQLATGLWIGLGLGLPLGLRVGVRSIIITYSTLLFVCCNWICAPKPQSRQFLSNRWVFFQFSNKLLSLCGQDRHWQPCPTTELVNITTSKVNKQLRRSKILQK